jgi:hypothetical protein
MGGGIVKRSWAGEVKNVSLLLATSIKDNHYHRLEPLIAITRTVTKNIGGSDVPWLDNGVVHESMRYHWKDRHVFIQHHQRID